MQQPSPSTIKQNGLVLANVSALAFSILSEVGDEHITRSIDGQSLTRDQIEQMVCLKATNTFQSKA